MKRTTNMVIALATVHGLINPASAALTPVTDAPSTSPPIDDIRPIRGAVDIPEPEQSTLLADTLPIAAGLLTIIVLTAVAVWLKRRSETRRIPNLQHKAIKALNDSKQLINQGYSRDYSIQVSDIVRGFIENRFNLPATQRTTDEFISELAKDNNLDLGPYRETLKRFLQQSDFGKFSGDFLNTEIMENLHQAALEVVQSESPDQQPQQGT